MDWTDPILVAIAIIVLAIILYFVGQVAWRYRKDCLNKNSQTMLCKILLSGKDGGKVPA